jgi:hypothetical protein
VPVPEDPLVALGSGAEDGVSALAGDTVIWGATVGICTAKSEYNVHGVYWRALPELQLWKSCVGVSTQE